MRSTPKDPLATSAARTLCELHRFYARNPDESLADDALLAYVIDCNQRKEPVCSSHLLRCGLFGSLATVTSRLASLLSRGLIVQVVDAERQIRLIEVSAKGIELLEQRSRLLKAALGPDFAVKS